VIAAAKAIYANCRTRVLRLLPTTAPFAYRLVQKPLCRLQVESFLSLPQTGSLIYERKAKTVH
jgi:hypothetical protein